MKTHSRILIQSCVLDILILIIQLFVQVFYLLDKEGKTVVIFPNGIMLNFINENFNPVISYIVALFWHYLVYLNLNGLCVQFIYRYLVLNRNLKINFLRYLFMLSFALFLTLLFMLNATFFLAPYSFGGIKYFDDFNKTLPFVQCKMESINIFSILLSALIEIFAYLIIIICGIKMVRYVNLNTNLDGNLKRLNKLLTKVLIILAVVPFINQAGRLFLVFFMTKINDTIDLFRILSFISFHLVPVFNPIICILTNTPYRNALFNRAQITPQ
uniref:G-protein coupled receptors family 1 profile domain-containing protein n=1 Tax=Meloidogyne enterolobii TaxID=390850 RepID=A0A6V7VA15_MELEN|nr:unnamed protein product [Meloidogyne enterolobii]